MRPSWWVPPKISKYRYRSAASPVHKEKTVSEEPQLPYSKEQEAERQEHEARREAKRANRRAYLDEEAAAKFRKDLEAAQNFMKRLRKSYAQEKEAAKNKPRLHSGGGNWGKYEYVWEEENEPSLMLEAGSKRSNRPTSFPNSPPRLNKKPRTEEDDKRASSRARSRAESSSRQSKTKASTKTSKDSQREEQHPANRRANRPRPSGPIFSAVPASPSREVLPDNDFDILPISTTEGNLPDSPIQLDKDEVPTGDVYDSDVEIIATNVSCAVREGRLEQEYGSNINPISLLGEDDNVIGDFNGSSDDDISYSAHFDASALHLMPVTPGSVNTGGVPSGTTDDSTGKLLHRNYPNSKTGITPLKHREIFRGTLSSPDVDFFVQPESYKQSKSMLERGAGTRAAMEAEERKRSLEGVMGSGGRRPKAPPLLHSAEAEVARARQAAAFLEGARRKPIQRPSALRPSAYAYKPVLSPPRSASPFQRIEADEEDPVPDEHGNDLETMLDTIVSSQLMDVDDPSDMDPSALPPEVAEGAVYETGVNSPSDPTEQDRLPSSEPIPASPAALLVENPPPAESTAIQENPPPRDTSPIALEAAEVAGSASTLEPEQSVGRQQPESPMAAAAAGGDIGVADQDSREEDVGDTLSVHGEDEKNVAEQEPLDQEMQSGLEPDVPVDDDEQVVEERNSSAVSDPEALIQNDGLDVMSNLASDTKTTEAVQPQPVENSEIQADEESRETQLSVEDLEIEEIVPNVLPVSPVVPSAEPVELPQESPMHGESTVAVPTSLEPTTPHPSADQLIVENIESGESALPVILGDDKRPSPESSSAEKVLETASSIPDFSVDVDVLPSAILPDVDMTSNDAEENAPAVLVTDNVATTSVLPEPVFTEEERPSSTPHAESSDSTMEPELEQPATAQEHAVEPMPIIEPEEAPVQPIATGEDNPGNHLPGMSEVCLNLLIDTYSFSWTLATTLPESMEVNDAGQKNIPAEIEMQNSAAMDFETAENQAVMDSPVAPDPVTPDLESDNEPTAPPAASENLAMHDLAGMLKVC